MKIGVYGVRGFPSTYGGYETFLTNLLPQLAERGHQVTVYCRRRSPDDVDGVELGVERRYLRSLPSKQLDTLTHGLNAAAHAIFMDHDVMLVCNIANAPFCGLGGLFGQPAVLNTDGQEWLRGKWGSAGRRYFLFCAQIARFCANLVSDGDEMAKIYETQFHARSTVIPYAWTGLVPHEDPTEVLSRHGLTFGGYDIAAGRSVPENNLDAVAEVYSANDLGRPLVVLGEANYRSSVTKRLDSLANSNRRVISLGHISDRCEFATLLAGARIHIHAHSVGGTNPGLIESMGLGTAIVALETRFNREVLADGGRFFASPDCGLAEQIASLTEADLALMRAANRERALTVYLSSAVTDAYEAVLQAVATGSVRRGFTLETAWRPSAARART